MKNVKNSKIIYKRFLVARNSDGQQNTTAKQNFIVVSEAEQ